MLTEQLDMLWSPHQSQDRSNMSTSGLLSRCDEHGATAEVGVTILGMARGSKWKNRNQRQPVFPRYLNNDVECPVPQGREIVLRREWDLTATSGGRGEREEEEEERKELKREGKRSRKERRRVRRKGRRMGRKGKGRNGKEEDIRMWKNYVPVENALEGRIYGQKPHDCGFL